MSMYEQMKSLFDLLNTGDLKHAREIMESLIKKGMNRQFMAELIKTLAVERMANILFNEVEEKMKK